LVESAEVVTEHAEKQSLRLRTDGVAVDMESAAVARVATAEGIPFSSVRTIADPLNMSFPNAVTIAMNPRGDVRLAVLLGHLVRHPGETGSLIALGRAFGAAVKTLHRVRHAVGDDFRLRSAT
jgi:adenosylhomocysteine nucleosidase